MFAALLRAGGFTLVWLAVIPLAAPPQHIRDSVGSDQGIDRGDVDQLSALGLPIESAPGGLILFHLNDDPHSYPSSPRLAVMNYDPSADRSRLRVLKAEEGKWAVEFVLDEPPFPDWEEMESFPSTRLPGIVLWAALESSRAHATVVAYVAGRFQVVFEGSCDEFVDLDRDGVPEILSATFPLPGSAKVEWLEVWTWNGKGYVLVGTSAAVDLYSRRVVGAIRRAKRTGQ